MKNKSESGNKDSLSNTISNITDIEPDGKYYSNIVPGDDDDIPGKFEDVELAGKGKFEDAELAKTGKVGDDEKAEGSEDDIISEDDEINLSDDDDSGDDEDLDYDGTPVPSEEELEEDSFSGDDNDVI